MSDVKFTLNNIRKTPFKGYQLKAVAVSSSGYSCGYSDSFDALIDPGAFHTCLSKSLMDEILDRIVGSDGNRLKVVGNANALGVYGRAKREPIYVIPHFYLGDIHLTDVAVTVLNTDNIQCLVGRSVLQQCVLTLDPEHNNMHFNFKESLKQQKQLVDDIMPFADVLQFAEFSTI